MAYIQLRIDDKLKSKVQKILKKMGLSLSDAIRVYLQQIMIKKGIPFTVITENGMTLERELEILRREKEALAGKNVTKAMAPEEAVRYLHKLTYKTKNGNKVSQKIHQRIR